MEVVPAEVCSEAELGEVIRFWKHFKEAASGLDWGVRGRSQDTLWVLARVT